MEISARKSHSIYHLASNSRTASHDGCRYDGDHRRKSFRRARSHKSSFDLADRRVERNHHRHRNSATIAGDQLDRDWDRRRVWTACGSTHSTPASVRMLDADCQLSRCSRGRRCKLNSASVRRAALESNRRPPSGSLSTSRNSRRASLTEILPHYASGSALDKRCRESHSQRFPCNSTCTDCLAWLTVLDFCLVQLKRRTNKNEIWSLTMETHSTVVLGAWMSVKQDCNSNGWKQTAAERNQVWSFHRLTEMCVASEFFALACHLSYQTKHVFSSVIECSYMTCCCSLFASTMCSLTKFEARSFLIQFQCLHGRCDGGVWRKSFLQTRKYETLRNHNTKSVCRD